MLTVAAGPVKQSCCGDAALLLAASFLRHHHGFSDSPAAAAHFCLCIFVQRRTWFDAVVDINAFIDVAKQPVTKSSNSKVARQEIQFITSYCCSCCTHACLLVTAAIAHDAD